MSLNRKVTLTVAGILFLSFMLLFFVPYTQATLLSRLRFLVIFLLLPAGSYCLGAYPSPVATDRWLTLFAIGLLTLFWNHSGEDIIIGYLLCFFAGYSIQGDD